MEFRKKYSKDPLWVSRLISCLPCPLPFRTGSNSVFQAIGFYVNTYGIILSFLSGTISLNVPLSTSRALVLFWIFLF